MDNNKQFIDKVRMELNKAEREEKTSYFNKFVLVENIMDVIKEYIPKIKNLY